MTENPIQFIHSKWNCKLFKFFRYFGCPNSRKLLGNQYQDSFFCVTTFNQLMVHCWFGARWFGILRVPLSKHSLSNHRGSQESKPPGPNQQFTVATLRLKPLEVRRSKSCFGLLGGYVPVFFFLLLGSIRYNITTYIFHFFHLRPFVS